MIIIPQWTILSSIQKYMYLTNDTRISKAMLYRIVCYTRSFLLEEEAVTRRSNVSGRTCWKTFRNWQVLTVFRFVKKRDWRSYHHTKQEDQKFVKYYSTILVERKIPRMMLSTQLTKAIRTEPSTPKAIRISAKRETRCLSETRCSRKTRMNPLKKDTAPEEQCLIVMSLESSLDIGSDTAMLYNHSIYPGQMN